MSFARSRILPLTRQTRLFSTSPFRASVLDTAKATVKEVDRKVSDAAVKGIEKGGMSSSNYPLSFSFSFFTLNQSTTNHPSTFSRSDLLHQLVPMLISHPEQATQKAKEVTGMKAEETKQEAMGNAHEMAGEAKATKEQMKGEAMGKKEELKGEAKATKEEIKHKM